MTVTATLIAPAMTDPHAYTPPSATDCRSPCPALNALANHGYLPRDGHNISFMQAVRAMKDVYNISYALGIFLAIGGMLLCGQWWRLPWKFDLHELAKHNKIEHDNSLCHRDSGPKELFAPCRADRTLLDRLLHITDNEYFTLIDFVHARAQRAKENRKPLNALHREIAHGESSLTICVFGKEPKIELGGAVAVAGCPKIMPRSFIEQWFGDDKLPDGWQKSEVEVGFLETVRVSRALAYQIYLQDWVARSA